MLTKESAKRWMGEEVLEMVALNELPPEGWFGRGVSIRFGGVLRFGSPLCFAIDNC